MTGQRGLRPRGQKENAMTKLQGHIIEQQRAKIERLEAEAEAWEIQYERVWKDRQLAYREIIALQVANAQQAEDLAAMRMDVKRLTIVTEGQNEDLCQADMDRKVLKQIWTEAEAQVTAERLKNADLQTALNLQREIARRHAARAEKAIESLEAIGWEFAVANFSSEDVESLIDDELEGRDNFGPNDFPF